MGPNSLMVVYVDPLGKAAELRPKCSGSIRVARCTVLLKLHSRKLTWKPKKGPVKTTALLKGVYMGFHVSLGECNYVIVDIAAMFVCQRNATHC